MAFQKVFRQLSNCLIHYQYSTFAKFSDVVIYSDVKFNYANDFYASNALYLSKAVRNIVHIAHAYEFKTRFWSKRAAMRGTPFLCQIS